MNSGNGSVSRSGEIPRMKNLRRKNKTEVIKKKKKEYNKKQKSLLEQFYSVKM